MAPLPRRKSASLAGTPAAKSVPAVPRVQELSASAVPEAVATLLDVAERHAAELATALKEACWTAQDSGAAPTAGRIERLEMTLVELRTDLTALREGRHG